jgi:predicted nuclease of predicted toxin-antitoxin system
VRFLIDNSVSWRIARDLRPLDHDAVHIADLGLANADDGAVYEQAVREQRVLITQDSDFDPIHAAAAARTGVLLLRLASGVPRLQSAIIMDNLPQITGVLENAGFVILEDAGIRVLDYGEPRPEDHTP